MTGPLLGIALKLGATLAFTLMYVAIKLAGAVPVGEVIFFRAFFALIPLFAVSLFTVGPRAVIATKRPRFHVVRSVVGVGSMFAGFAALQMLPLADITAFQFVMPIFAVVLAALFLRETVGIYRSSAVVIAFAGVLLMLEPHGGLGKIATSGFSLGAALALIGAFLAAVVVVFIRQMSVTEKSETIVFYFMVACAIAGALSMIWDRVPLDVSAAAMLVLCGILGGVGQLCMTYSYRFAEPSLLAPFDYVAMVWAVAFGFLFFAEVPETLVMAGAGVVIAAGLFIVWRERRLGRGLGVRRLPSV